MSKSSMLSKSIIDHFLLFILGVCMAFGEQLNQYCFFSSHLFVIVGAIVSGIVFVRSWVTRERKTIVVYSKEYGAYLLLLLYLLLLFSGKLVLDIAVLDGGNILDYYKQIIFMIIGVSVFSTMKRDKHFVSTFLKGFLIGYLVLLPVGVYKVYDGTQRFLGTYINPNAYAPDCCLAFFCALYLAQNKKLRVFKYAIAGLALLILVLTGTRGALVGMVISFLLLIIQSKKIGYKMAVVAAAVTAIFVAYIYMNIKDQSLLDRYLSRGISGAADLRITIWLQYLRNVKYYFWTGIKESDFSIIYKKSPHNTLLGTFVRHGIVAFLIYARLVLGLLIKSIKLIFSRFAYREEKFVCCMFVTSFIAGMFTENWGLRSTYIILALCLATNYKYERSQKEKMRLRNIYDYRVLRSAWQRQEYCFRSGSK